MFSVFNVIISATEEAMVSIVHSHILQLLPHFCNDRGGDGIRVLGMVGDGYKYLPPCRRSRLCAYVTGREAAISSILKYS